MSTNETQTGRYITTVALEVLTSGQGYIHADLFLVAQLAAGIGDTVTGDTQGVHTLPANSGDTFTLGAPVFWDVSAEECVDTAVAGDIQIGVAMGAADGDDDLGVRLDGIGRTIAV